MPYDDLVKRLRASVDGRYEKCDGCPYEEDYPCCVDCLDKMHKQAAEAIEELSEQLLEMGQVGKFLLDVHKINSKMVAPESVPTDSEWWSHYKALLEVLYLPRWIPVTDRLPEKFENVLVANKRGKHYDIDKGWWNGSFFDRCAKGGYHNVTHWMPLPPVPKEET